MTYVSRPVPSPEEQMASMVIHASDCWGCMDQGEESHWEIIHCKCCVDLSKESND